MLITKEEYCYSCYHLKKERSIRPLALEGKELVCKKCGFTKEYKNQLVIEVEDNRVLTFEEFEKIMSRN